MIAEMKSLRAQRALRQVGENLKTARLKRRMAVEDLANRVGVSDRTIMRLEKGDPGVGMSTLVMASFVLGEIDRFSDQLDPGTDQTAPLLERKPLPKRAAAKRKRAPRESTSAGLHNAKDDGMNDDGVGI